MKRSFFLVLLVCLYASYTNAQVRSVTTNPTELAQKKFKMFVAIDQKTGYTLGHPCVKYNEEENMPVIFFTQDISTNLIRLFVINGIQDSNTPDDFDWVLNYNSDEKDMFFARSRFILHAPLKQWNVLPDGKNVIIQNILSGKYLTVDQQGDLAPADEMVKASRWKLIRVN
ncbi:MAG: hypothetical protein ACERKD_03360 [Prolixibacteraceae bacterium]